MMVQRKPFRPDKAPYDTNIHRRRSIRLKGYDYSQEGAYFITICSHKKECLFGKIVETGSESASTTKMVLNEYGEIVDKTWDDLANHIGGIEQDAFVVMPNHIHGIIFIVDNVGAGSEPTPTKHALPEIVRQLKTFSARRINEKRGTLGNPVWQCNYFEHIIRNDKSYNEIATYIVNNPMQWRLDQLYPGDSP